MEHRMILVSADFKEVHKVVIAKRRADVVSIGKTADPYSAVEGSNPSIGSIIEEVQEETQWGE